MYKRILAAGFPTKISVFIFGPRQTGKSTLVEQFIKYEMKVDLLITEEFLKYNKDPDLLMRKVKILANKSGEHVVWIDEVQKIPTLLDVIHGALEKYKNIKFVITGSSARKLRRSSANLLGGRALDLRLHPLSIEELGEAFDFNLVLNYGSLPHIYEFLEVQEIELAKDLLNSYVTTYLSEEIKQEGLVKTLDSFQRFLDVAAGQFGELVNYANIANDCLSTIPTVQNYYSILEDTLIGNFLLPFAGGIRKQLAQQPKFYFFDNGVTRAMLGELNNKPSRIVKGHLFEQLVFNELRKLSDYYKKSFKFFLWRTSSGVEVDFLVCRGKKILLAIECKTSNRPRDTDTKALRIFAEQHPRVKKVLCCTVSEPQDFNGIVAMNLKDLLVLVTKL